MIAVHDGIGIPFNTLEKKELPFLLDDAADAVELLIRNGLLEAQQKFHAPA